MAPGRPLTIGRRKWVGHMKKTLAAQAAAKFLAGAALVVLLLFLPAGHTDYIKKVRWRMIPLVW